MIWRQIWITAESAACSLFGRIYSLIVYRIWGWTLLHAHIACIDYFVVVVVVLSFISLLMHTTIFQQRQWILIFFFNADQKNIVVEMNKTITNMYRKWNKRNNIHSFTYTVEWARALDIGQYVRNWPFIECAGCMCVLVCFRAPLFFFFSFGRTQNYTQ